jgi:MFS family permease
VFSQERGTIKRFRLPHLHTLDSLISYRDYRLLWTGNFCSNSAQWLQLLTIGWLVRDLTVGSSTSVLQVVIVGGLSTLPVLLVGPWGGVWGDRVDRRKLLMRIQTFMAVLAVFFAVLVVSNRGLGLSDNLRVWLAYSYVLVSGVCLSIAQPMRQALIANTVPPEAFGNAYATNSLSITGTRIIGPFIGGILISSLGFTANFLLEAALYASMVLFFIPMKTPFQSRVLARRRSPVADFSEGVRFIRRERRIILTLILLSLIPNVVLHQVWFLLPVFTADTIQQDADVGGFLLAATGVGGFASSVIIASVGFTFKKGPVVLASLLVSSIFVILFAWSPWIVPMFPLVPALVFIGLMSLAQSHFRTTNGTLIQLITPDRFRSRVTSLASYGQGFVFPFSIMVGLLAEFSGVVSAITMLGVIGLILTVDFTIRLPEVRHEP